MNETIQSILNRRSVRSYQEREVEEEKINTILECGKYAPSAMGRQPWHFTVVTDKNMLKKISDGNKALMLKSDDENRRKQAEDPNFDIFRGAPMVILVSGQKDLKHIVADVANAVENMALAAHSLGLSSCYMAGYRAIFEAPEGQELLSELKLPENHFPFYALALGYGNVDHIEPAPRRENMVTYIR